MAKPMIEVRQLGKRYRLGQVLGHDTLRDRIVSILRSTNGAAARDFWALRNVSFEVKEGEVLGVIGHNGAGKSTLLKILSRITEPTEGEARLRGRVAGLLEVGTGFHRELTGRENIYLNGAILGMTRGEVNRKFDAIVSFAGVEQFIDTPVKRYSSGMTVRLAFAVAAHLEPEILLIDEVLAVGDAEFQRRCLQTMSDVTTAGRTILFVSHNLAAVEALCMRALLLEKGGLAAIGDTRSIITEYMQRTAGGEVFCSESGVVRRVAILDATSGQSNSVSLGGDAIVQVDLVPEQAVDDLVILVIIVNSLGQRVVACVTRQQLPRRLTLDRNTRFTCRIHELRLVPGQYAVTVILRSTRGVLQQVDECLKFDVLPRDLFGTGHLPRNTNAVYLPDATWTEEKLDGGPEFVVAGAAKLGDGGATPNPGKLAEQGIGSTSLNQPSQPRQS
jgi:lipopolysaccharide transport system ATP-binding protein